MPQALLVMGSSILYAAGGIALTSTAAIMAVGALGYLAATAATSMALNALIPKPKLQGVNQRLSNQCPWFSTRPSDHLW
jgi:hypothetical protein